MAKVFLKSKKADPPIDGFWTNPNLCPGPAFLLRPLGLRLDGPR